MTELPAKLKVDAIMESVLEVRFVTDAAAVPEILFGRFADLPEWKGFRIARLPLADMPEPVRRLDPGLRFLPTFELTSPDGTVAARVGPQVIIYARRLRYPGWTVFGAELRMVVDRLFGFASQLTIRRLGLRYINAMRSDAHGIEGI